MDQFIETLILIQLPPWTEANIGDVYMDTNRFNTVSNGIKVLNVWLPIRRLWSGLFWMNFYLDQVGWFKVKKIHKHTQ